MVCVADLWNSGDLYTCHSTVSRVLDEVISQRFSKPYFHGNYCYNYNGSRSNNF